MNPYYNLPLEQRVPQQLVEQLNADERLWKTLASRRRGRRKLHPFVSRKQRKKHDLLEFAAARPLRECIGYWRAK